MSKVWDIQFLHILVNTRWSVFGSLAILVDIKWFLIVILILISLMMNNVQHKHVFIVHLHIFFGEMSTQILFPFFKLDYLSFLLLSCKYSLRILNISSLSNILFENIFSHSTGCLFTLMMSFRAQRFQFWWNPMYIFLF